LKNFGIIIGGFLLSFSGGATYSWGVFTIPLMELFGWNKFEANFSFTVFMLVFSLCMLPAGMAADRFGYRLIARVGSILFLPAYLLASLVGIVGHTWWLPMTHGLLGGIGCACVYSVIAPAIRSHVDKNTSLAVSVAVMGFGLASVFLAPVKANLLITGLSVPSILALMGLIVFALSFSASFLMPDKNKGKIVVPVIPLSKARETLGNMKFYMLWFVFAFSVVGGFLSIGLFPSFARIEINADPPFAALVVSVFSAVNGFGRPVAGFFSEKIGFSKILLVSGIFQFLFLLLLGIMPSSAILLIVVSAVTGWSFAVILGLFPSFTASVLGSGNLGTKYGMVFTGFGLGALALLGGSLLYDLNGSFRPAFLLAAVASLISVVILLLLLYFHKEKRQVS